MKFLLAWAVILFVGFTYGILYGAVTYLLWVFLRWFFTPNKSFGFKSPAHIFWFGK